MLFTILCLNLWVTIAEREREAAALAMWKERWELLISYKNVVNFSETLLYLFTCRKSQQGYIIAPKVEDLVSKQGMPFGQKLNRVLMWHQQGLNIILLKKWNAVVIATQKAKEKRLIFTNCCHTISYANVFNKVVKLCWLK